MNRFDGKVAVVTGAASGIGAAITRLLVAEGARVVLGDVSEEAGAGLAAELGADHALFQRCNVAEQADLEALVKAAVDAFGGLDLLFNNAGIGTHPASTPELAPEVWHKVIAVNLHSVFYGCRAAIPEMRRRGGGAIVNTASISGLAGDYGFNAYNAAKAAVINYTRTLAIDHAADNIRVNALCPGFIDTPLTAAVEQLGIRTAWLEGIPMKRAGTPHEMGKVAVFLACDDASYMTGSVVVADGGLTAATGQPNIPRAIAQLGTVGLG